MPNSWIGTIVILLVIAAQVIPAILQSIAKKRKEQQAREAAAARRAQQIPEEFRTPIPVVHRPEAPTQPISQPLPEAGMVDVAARRKAQLEQLRNRRENRRVGPDGQGQTGPAVGSPTRVASPTPVASPLPRGVQPVDLRSKSALKPGLDLETKRRQQEDARQLERRIAQTRSTRQQQSLAAPKTRLRQPIPSEADAARAAQGQLRLDEAQSAQARQRRADSKNLQRVLRQSSALREAFVLKELLDQPVSLR